MRIARALAAVLAVGLAVRLAYVFVQPGSDPDFAHPVLDGAYYLDWARTLGSGTGAYYLAPLYSVLLAGFLAVLGERFFALYVTQQVVVVLAAGVLALCGRKFTVRGAGPAAAGLLLLYHPALYFASRPIAEPVALLLLALSLLLSLRESKGAAFGSGLVVGLAGLARPNLLLVPLVWAGMEAGRRNWARAGLILAGCVLALLPVTLRNARVSGHLVPVSSNAGITLYHGNAPGATGIGTLPAGFSGRVSTQRDEATRVASFTSGRALDAVEADRWWGGRALEARLDDPLGSARLLVRRAALCVSNVELSLDYAPAIDANPWRWAAALPFALIVGLAAAGVYLAGWRGSGGWPVWGAIAACAAAPLLFYVSSRYRFPAAALLCLPAGAGLCALYEARGRRRAVGLAVAGAVALVSVVLPVGDLQSTSEAVALANRAVSWSQRGDLERSTADYERALARDPNCVQAHFGLGVLAAKRGRTGDAEAHYRTVLSIDPFNPDSAGNLARPLILGGRTDEAIALLRRALELHPEHATCRINLVAALYASGDVEAALEAVDEAERAGVTIDPELVDQLRRSQPH